jgi:hypothetical protein
VKVFISWSGALSRALALELREWLPMVVHQVDPWISGRDISPGQRWALALGHELAQSEFAIICLTSENRRSPWLLFEAGAVARSLEARVVPLLFGIEPSDLDGPLAQFQSLQADEPGIRSLVSALYDISQSGLETHQRDLVFARLWPLVEARLRELATQAPDADKIESSIDLVADLTSSKGPPATLAVQKFVIGRLEAEREQLRRQLEYLNAEEEKLTRQDAPISLEERAIQPTEQRLGQVETTLKIALDQAFEALSSSQIDLLLGLVTETGVQPGRSPQDYAFTDINSLLELGLIAIDDRGMIIMHDFVAGYVRKRYGAG